MKTKPQEGKEEKKEKKRYGDDSRRKKIRVTMRNLHKF